MTGQVDRLAFTFAGTTPKISIVTANGLDHTIGYDAAGNETSYLANRTYSARNLMNTVTDTSGEGPAHQLTYGYDWRGVRVSRTETPTDAGSASRYFFYSPELQLLESTVDDSTNVWGQSAHHIASAPLVANRDIIWFNGAPVAEIGPPRTPDNTPLATHRTFATAMDATNTFWTFTDHLGTPLIQMDNSRAIVWRAEHEPYGNVWKMRAGARTDQPLRFPGQELAMTWEGAEENYNVFRWYRAGWGRYAQGDPIGLTGGASLYSYTANEPLRATDRLGLFCTKDFVAHYLGGSGTTINLASVGLLSTFTNSPSVKGAMLSERIGMLGWAAAKAKELCTNCNTGKKSGKFTSSGSDNANPFLDNTPCVGWPIGSTMLNVTSTCRYEADCGSKTYSMSCKSAWALRDKFTNPFSQGEPGGNPGKPNDFLGTPYDINADWVDIYYGGGTWH